MARRHEKAERLCIVLLLVYANATQYLSTEVDGVLGNIPVRGYQNSILSKTNFPERPHLEKPFMGHNFD